MFHPPPTAIDERLYVLRSRWQNYLTVRSFEHFIEFTVAVNSLTEYFNRLRLSGLVRLCEALESTSLARLGDAGSHPILDEHCQSLQLQLDALSEAVSASRTQVIERRQDEAGNGPADAEWIKPRSVWLISSGETPARTHALREQLEFLGFLTLTVSYHEPLPEAEAPLAALFIPPLSGLSCAEIRAHIAKVRQHCPSSQLIHLDAPVGIEEIVALMRAGIDQTLPQEDGAARVLNCVLDLVQHYDPEKYRVLVVEDSRVAVTLIQHTLAEHGIDSQAIRDPGSLLETLSSYRPDLVLMDMYMPRFNGVEATRVLRQMSPYASLPIVYLSGESDVGMQVEALRLGGDQFITKPFNPVLLAAVIKSKIERYRGTQRSTRLDGLTGLLNHTAAKSLLAQMSHRLDASRSLTVAMIDIDHFKSINDTYGHPVGDQVIRGLAWLLKGRLRTTDLIGRYGGEEFIVALPDVSPSKAAQVIDRIRADFASLPHAHPHGTIFASFSAGIASTPEFHTAHQLTEAADYALLEAKRRGRNRVELATPASLQEGVLAFMSKL